MSTSYIAPAYQESVGGLSLASPDPDAEDTLRIRRAVESVLGNVLVAGNELRVLRNGDEIFPAMLAAIEEAEHSIDFVTFVYWTGDIAQRFASALAQKAHNGVRVRVILDGFGSLPMSQKLIEKMRAAGAVVERFRPIVRWKLWESDHRTHRKILVCDDKVGFTGGVGIASEWEGDARNPDEWRDTHFEVRGPAVLGLRAAFMTDWRDTGHRIDLADIDVERPAEAGTVDLAVVDGSAQIGVNDAERVIEALVAAAHKSIRIQTPYFNPTDELVGLLVEARRRRVDVDLIVPGPHIDKRVSRIVAKDNYASLVDHGVRVWEYQPTMMHVKAMLVDGVAAMIGSVNVNRRSVEKDEEVAVIALDRGVVQTLTEHFDDDVAASLPMVGTRAEPSPTERLVAKLLLPIRREF